MLRGMLCVCVVCVETYIPHRGLGEALLTHGLLEHLELSLGHRGRCQRKSKGQGQERESQMMKKTEGGRDRQGVQGKHNIRQSQICTPYYKAQPSQSFSHILLAVMLCLSKSTAALAVSWFKKIFALMHFQHISNCRVPSPLKACGLCHKQEPRESAMYEDRRQRAGGLVALGRAMSPGPLRRHASSCVQTSSWSWSWRTPHVCRPAPGAGPGARRRRYERALVVLV